MYLLAYAQNFPLYISTLLKDLIFRFPKKLTLYYSQKVM